MKQAAIGVLLGMVAMAAIGNVTYQPRVFAQQGVAFQDPSAASLLAFSSAAGPTHHQVTIVDPRARTLAVYHVGNDDGRIALMGVRNIHWDLQMEVYNPVDPAPRAIRAQFEPH